MESRSAAELRHAHALPALRTTRTGVAMAAAVQAGLLAAGDAAELTAAWELAARIRNAIMLVRGRPGTPCRPGTAS